MIQANSANPVALAWFGLIGLIVGSFLNVVIYRVPLGFRVTLPTRSACRACKRKLRWFENIPVLSYLLIRGRCLECRTLISPRYPLVELMNGALFVAVYLNFGLTFSAFYHCVFVASLVAITFIDLDHRIIPDTISVSGAVLGLAGSPWVLGLGWMSSLEGVLAGGLLFGLLAWGYERATGREGLGFGDVKLLAMIGAFTGVKGALATVLVSSVVGSVTGVTIMIVQRKNLKLAIPFGPFLAIGALTALFWGDAIAFRIYL